MGRHNYICEIHVNKHTGNNQHVCFTLLANSTAGMGFPLDSKTLLSRSDFHICTASNVERRVTSKTTKAPTASL